MPRDTLKVCIFTETYFPVVGGGETQARLLGQGLSERGVKTIIVTRRSDPSLAKVERLGDVTVHRLPPTGRHHLNKWGLLLSGFPALFKLRREYDVIVVSGFRVIGVPAVLVSWLLGKTCLLKADCNGEMSGEFFRGGLKKAGWRPDSRAFRMFLRIRNAVLRRADAFVAISNGIADEFVANGVEPRSKVKLIANSVDTGVFHPVSRQEARALRQKLGLPLDKMLFVFTGRLVSYKGLPLLLEVWKRLRERHDDASLVLVGGRSLDIFDCEAQLRAYVAANDLAGAVQFSGEVRNVHEYLQAADGFVFPSEQEAFPLAMIEAMACGLPVVSTAIGGLKDILVDGQNALVVTPGNGGELLDALDRVISDPAYAKTLGCAALVTVEKGYRKETVTEQYCQLFDAISKQRGHAPVSGL
jgi:glycosyltransferase involved in cell wall biosynthesis